MVKTTGIALVLVLSVACAGENGMDGTDGTDGTDGEDGDTVLIRIDPEDPGDNCADGGVAVHSGIDDDADGILDDDEIDATEYVCDGTGGPNDVHFGSVVITDAADVAALAGIRMIVGYLRIESPLLTDIDLPELEEIIGGLTVTNNPALEGLGLTALTQVGTDILIHDNPVLSAIAMPYARSVGFTSIVGDSLQHVTVAGPADLPGYLHVGDYGVDTGDATLYIGSFAGNLVSLALAPVNVGGELEVIAFTITLDLGTSLSSVGGLSLTGPSITDAVVGGFSQVDGLLGNLVISETDLTQVDPLSGITGIEGDLTIGDNPDLATVGLGNLEFVDGDVFIGYNASLTTLNGMANVEVLNSSVIVNGCPLLTDLGILSSATTQYMDFLALDSLPLVTDLSELAGETILGYLYLYETGIADLSALSSLTRLDGLDIRDQAVASLAPLAGVTEMRELVLMNVSGMSSLNGLHNLSILSADPVHANFHIEGCANLANLDALADLQDVYAHLTISDNPLLTNITALENVTSWDGGVTVTDNDLLPSCQVVDLGTHLDSVGYLAFLVNTGNYSAGTCN